jgi:RNA polymerase sigma factor (sigma-70 family)
MAKPSDNLIKHYRDKKPGAEDALARYLLATLPIWISGSFSQVNYQDIEDLTSLLTVHLLSKIDMFHGRSNASFDTWARKVARNRIYDWFAKEGRQRKREVPLDNEDEEEGYSHLDTLASSDPSPSEALDWKIAREFAMEALERVKNGRQKLILKEHYISGLSIFEIAERWGEKKRNKLDVLKCQALQVYLNKVKEMQSEGRLDKCSPRVRGRK